MPSRNASSRGAIQLDSSLSYHEPLDRHKGRKRRRAGSLEYRGEDEDNKTELISSMSATIQTLKRQVSCLQRLLHDANAPRPTNSTRYTCPAASCRKHFKKSEHLYRHIRGQSDPTHEPLAGLINETHCLICSKTSSRPQDLVKHEKIFHGETYNTRLDKVLGTSLPASPPSSTSVAIDDTSNSSNTHDEELRRIRSTSGLDHKSSSHRAPRPPASHTNISVGGGGTPAIEYMNTTSSADKATVSELSENSQGSMTPPQVMGLEVIKAGSRPARNPIQPTFETDCTSGSSAFGPLLRNRVPEQPGLPLGPQSWDSFYGDKNGVVQDSGNEKWDSFYIYKNGLIQNAWMEKWDGFYVDKNGVIQNIREETSNAFPNDAPGATERGSSRGYFPTVPVDPLNGFTPAFESGRDA